MKKREMKKRVLFIILLSVLVFSLTILGSNKVYQYWVLEKIPRKLFFELKEPINNIVLKRKMRKVEKLPNYKWEDDLVYHAGGGINNLTYTN